MRLLLLVDGLHTKEQLEALAQLVRLADSELLLVYVLGPATRASLDMVSHRPGGRHMTPRRERDVSMAEHERALAALAEAESLARPLTAATDSMQVEGDAGHAVCDVAAAKQVDLIALWARGRDGPPVGMPALGPAARYVADHAPCPVLLLRGR